MIDRLLSAVGQRKPLVFEADFGPQRAVTEQYLEVPDGGPRRLTAVYGFWHAPNFMLKMIANRLGSEGSDVLLYNLHHDILNDDPRVVRDSFYEVVSRSVASIVEIQQEREHTQTDILAFSLGNVPASMAASALPAFNKMTMVVPGTDLLRCLWGGIRTQQLRQMLEANGTTYELLESEWEDLAPIKHVDALIGHEVDVYLSARDRFIPYRYGQELVGVMENRAVEPHVKTSQNIGHALTIANYVRQI